jgi:tetrahydromethanopterin S-methyltransferase subunit G
MGDEYNKEVCDIKHATISDRLSGVESKVDTMGDKLDRVVIQVAKVVGILTGLGVLGSAAVKMIG